MSSRPRIQAPEEMTDSFTLKLSESASVVQKRLANNKRFPITIDNTESPQKKSSNRIQIKFAKRDIPTSSSSVIPVINYDESEETPDTKTYVRHQPIQVSKDESDESDESPAVKTFFRHQPIKISNEIDTPKPVFKRQPIKVTRDESSSPDTASINKSRLIKFSLDKSSSPSTNSSTKLTHTRKPITFDDHERSTSKSSVRERNEAHGSLDRTDRNSKSDRNGSSERRESRRRRRDSSESPERKVTKRTRRDSPANKFARRPSIQLNRDSPRSANDSFFRSPATSNDRTIKCNFQQPPVYKGHDGRFYVAFFTNKYIFSNHFLCPSGITVDGLHFSTTEHYYMYQKAIFNDNEKVSKEIMACKDPKQAKRIASRLAGFDNNGWKKIQYKVMEKACLAKFQQNPLLRRELFRTCNAVLVEASPSDRRWGVGLTIDDEDVADESKWQGSNLLGKLLMNVRTKLATEFADEFEAEHVDAKRDLQRRAIC